MRALPEAFGLQPQLDGCKHEVMIAADVGTRERPCVFFVDDGPEALGCQEKVYLVVNLPSKGTPNCCPGQLVGVETVGRMSRWLSANSRQKLKSQIFWQ